MGLASILIHKEQQFNALRNKFKDYAGCASGIHLQQIQNGLVLILTTQRTGSTLLCQDIESSLGLDYSPTESFIPMLQGFSTRSIPPLEMTKNIEDHLESFAGSKITVIKCMIDYVGWLGFLSADREMALTASYKALSYDFVNKLRCIDAANFYKLVRLDRRDKLKQSVSRLINAMGLPTHIRTIEDVDEFEKNLEEKLERYPDYHCMIADQLGIILRQVSLLDGCLDLLKSTKDFVSLEFESDLLERKDAYLFDVFHDSGMSMSEPVRSLIPTSGNKSKEMLLRFKKSIGV